MVVMDTHHGIYLYNMVVMDTHGSYWYKMVVMDTHHGIYWYNMVVMTPYSSNLQDNIDKPHRRSNDAESLSDLTLYPGNLPCNKSWI